jgi:putative membrane-bound dehydrogenase-like protein
MPHPTRSVAAIASALLAGVALAAFPEPYDSEPDAGKGPPPPGEVAAGMTLPPGFRAGVFAAEPDVRNPIACAWDARGRLWVAENYTYAERTRKFEMRLRDRIIILADTDGDGRADKRTVFADDLQMLTGLETAPGGVWVMCPPQLLFIPDRDGDDKPDGPAEVRLDGFTVPPENYHNFANGLRWGPDGWLYGRCGASAPAEVGPPGTPAAGRVPVRGTVWRYHPGRRVVEALACGTTNPWGHDWDSNGELFFINTVNGHLWHAVAGEHFVRPHTIDPNPHVYALIDQHADHWHFDTAKGWSNTRETSDALGGGHAHAGMTIYQGDNLPAEYRGRLFTLNLHGRRANQELLERRGSGYVGRHGPDLLRVPDRWFRGMEITYGPDGGLFVLDWSDTGECHESTGVHRSSGRIYKVWHGTPKPPAVADLTRATPAELVALHRHPNEWYARQARLQLVARADRGDAVVQLRAMAADGHLRALWTLYACGAADAAFLRGLLRHGDEHVRVWAIRLLADDWPLDTVLSRRPADGPPAERVTAPLPEFIRMAKEDESGLVRLTLASTLQRIPPADRPALAAALVAHAEDAADHNLPLLVWYGLIPVADADPHALARLAAGCEWPTTRRLIARRLAEDVEKRPAPLGELLTAAATKDAVAVDVLAGLAEGLKGWRKAAKPAGWDALTARLAKSPDDAVRARVRDLSALFGDGRALDEVRKVALDAKADLAARKAALAALIDHRPHDLRPVCEKLLGVRFLNPVAARGLATFNDPAVGTQLVKAYRLFHPSERPQLLATLVSRPSFARALLDAVAAGGIPRAEVSAYHARQIAGFADKALTARLAEVWGEFRESAAERREQIAALKKRLTPAALAAADPGRGRATFAKVCASCHRLYGEGGDAGPDLTGANRDNLDYLLENIVDPGAVVTADFRVSVVALADGRVLHGIVTARTEKTLTLRTMTESVTVAKADVESVTASSASLMPDNLLQGLDDASVRDLFAYLNGRTQVPLPGGGK